MLEGLDDIPWSKLGHAYGSAADVPGLLRRVGIATEGTYETGSPLWELFGNIWHQGTIYEATAYAVPFLLELAEDHHTPNRVGVLDLLGAIAASAARRINYRRQHAAEARMLESSIAPDPDDQAMKVLEAHYEQFARMTHEAGAVRIGVAHVLAQMPGRAAEAADLILELLAEETLPARRGAYLLLLGSTRHAALPVLAQLHAALDGPDPNQRCAAAIAFVAMPGEALPAAAEPLLREFMKDPPEHPIVVADLWDVLAEIDFERIEALLGLANEP